MQCRISLIRRLLSLKRGVVVTEFGAALDGSDECLHGLAEGLKALPVQGAYHWHGWHNGVPFYLKLRIPFKSLKSI